MQRSKKLANEAIHIWSYPQTNFEREVDRESIYSLHEDLDMRNTKPVSLLINDEEYKISHWWDVKKVICRKLYHGSPTKFREIMQRSEISRYFSIDQENNLSVPFEFVPHCFVDIH